MTEPTTVKSSIVRLSVFLAQCQGNELLHILGDYEQGVMSVLESIPIEGESFTVSVTQLNGKNVKRTVAEEAIRDTPEARHWRDEKAESTRLAIMASTGEISTTLEAVSENPDEFDKLIASRRAFLKNNKGKSRVAPSPAKKAPTVATPAPTEPKNAKKSGGNKAQASVPEQSQVSSASTEE